MDIRHEENGNRGAFFIERDGKRVAEMTYQRTGDEQMVIDHTEVDDALQGEGIGESLVEKGVGFARENGLTVVPQCPFARAVIEKDPDLQDVLK